MAIGKYISYSENRRTVTFVFLWDPPDTGSFDTILGPGNPYLSALIGEESVR